MRLSQDEVRGRLQEIYEKVNQIERALYGNGDPANSIQTRLIIMERDLRLLRWVLGVFTIAMLGTLARLIVP